MLAYPHPASQFIHATEGGFDGLDHDLLELFAASLGVGLRVEPVTRFEDLIPALLAGRGDVIGSSFSITEARRELVEFSIPYFPVLTMVVAPSGFEGRSPTDLGGLRAATVKGSSQEEILLGLERVRILHTPTSLDAYAAVRDGRADFLLADSTSALVDLDLFPQLALSFQLAGVQHYGFAVAPGTDWLDDLDEHIRGIQDSGIYYRKVQMHLGARGAELYLVATSSDTKTD